MSWYNHLSRSNLYNPIISVDLSFNSSFSSKKKESFVFNSLQIWKSTSLRIFLSIFSVGFNEICYDYISRKLRLFWHYSYKKIWWIYQHPSLDTLLRITIVYGFKILWYSLFILPFLMWLVQSTPHETAINLVLLLWTVSMRSILYMKTPHRIVHGLYFITLLIIVTISSN